MVAPAAQEDTIHRARRWARSFVPTLITFGARDLVCSTRFAEPLKSGIALSELVSSTTCRTPGCTRTQRSDRAILDFLLRQRS